MELSKLGMPFSAKDVEWRIGMDGIKNNNVWAMALCYVTNRAIMDRLDDVCGAGNWKNHYEKAPDGGILCGISIKVDSEWVTKWDGAESTQIEAVKGGLSGAMKRAGVQWGIGRYLYNLESTFVKINDKGKNKGCHIAKDKKRTYYRWDTPTLPSWALPCPETATKEQIKIIDDIFTYKELEQGDIDNLRIYYCNAKKVPVVEFEDMTVDLIENLILKFETVYTSWKKIIEK